VTGDATFQADRSKLTKASLQATIPATDNISGAEVQVEVDLTWTGAGELASESQRFRFKQAGLLLSSWFKGFIRPATASGTVLVGGENIATDASIFADIFRVRLGELDVVRSR
jgi:hypothetical protein